MPRPSYKLSSSVDSPAVYDPARLDEIAPIVLPPESDDTQADPYRYGWRERWETLPDGSSKLRVIPLTYEDTLNPQLGDCVPEDSIHRKLTENVSGILELRYEDQPTVAVWSDLKVRTPSPRKGSAKRSEKDAPEGSKGPAPDICVVSGVRDRERRRRSFCLEEEPGEILLTVEVVSKESARKDYKDILKLYTRLKVTEYVLIDAKGDYLDGPVDLLGWRRNPKTNRLGRIAADREGRLLSETTGLLFGTGPGGRGLELRDAATGELLRPPAKEAAWQARRAEQEARRAEQEAQRAEQEAAARRKAEAEVERLKALLSQT